MKFETGDIVLVKVNDFSTWYRWLLAKFIQFFDGVYYHHAGTIVNGLLYEADKKVIKRIPRHLVGDEIIVFRLKVPLSDPEKIYYEKLAEDTLGRSYDYWGTMFHQLIYILTLRRIWIGKTKKSARKKPYCTELAVHMINQIRGYFPQPWKTGPSALISEAPRYYNVVFEGKYE